MGFTQNIPLNLCVRVVNSTRFFVVEKMDPNVGIKAYWFKKILKTLLYTYFSLDLEERNIVICDKKNKRNDNSLQQT